MDSSRPDDRYQTTSRTTGDYARKVFDALRDDARIGFGLLAAISIAAGVFWYRGATALPASPSGLAEVSVANSPENVVAAPSSSTSTLPLVITVHVGGAVRSPGVVEVPPGSRVVDALDAAGGPLARADLDRLNLAALIVDGDRILVARIGDPQGVASITSSSGGSIDSKTPAIINLNSATALELEALPGIGPTLAAAIIAERDASGGFTTVEDLRSVHGIGDSRFADISELVMV